MSGLSVDDQVTMVELFVILLGVVFTWAAFYGSDRAELPGEASIPDGSVRDDMELDTRGRTL